MFRKRVSEPDAPTGPDVSRETPAAADVAAAPADAVSAEASVTAPEDAGGVVPAASGTAGDGGNVTPTGQNGRRMTDAVSASEPGQPGPVRPLPRRIAVANQKGGVGKTTTTINVGACLAELGLRTLVVDLDPQGNATTGLGIENRGLEASMYEVLLHDVPIENVVEPTAVKNLFVAPASLNLAGAEIELASAFNREQRLRRAIEAVLDDYDYVLIDCPPTLGLLTVNGLAAAAEVLVPIQTEYYALEGLGLLLRNVDLIRKQLNPELEVSSIVCVMYDASTKLSAQVVDEVRNHFGDKVVRAIVPRNVRLSEAPSHGQPIIIYDPRSRGAVAYRDVAKEVHYGKA